VQLDETSAKFASCATIPCVGGFARQSVVACLAPSTIKRSGGTLFQMQGQGPVSLLVAECSSEFGLRCTARWEGKLRPAPLQDLIGNGRCAITLGAGDGRALYQGIVPLESARLAAALESYMLRSEQLETRLWLFAGASSASGLLLQRVPEQHDTDADAFNRVTHLGATVTANELGSLAAPTLLRRLFPEDDVRLFGGRTLRFACTCTRERVSSMLQMLGRTEVEQVIAAKGKVDVTCEFCNRAYAFSAQESRMLFAAPRANASGNTSA
jgi:molecular chaperone Hsp33